MKRILLLALVLLFARNPAKSQYWQPVPSGTNANLLSVSFGSLNVGYISGKDSLLLRTLDGGRTWKPLAHSGFTFGIGNTDIIHVNFLSADTGYAIVGDVDFPIYNGLLFKTTDSGKIWKPVNPGNIAASRTFFFDAGNGFVIGSAFFAGKTVIRQKSGVWLLQQQFSFDPREFLYGIDFRNQKTGIVGGHDGYVHRTFDGGDTWDTVKTVVDSMINTLKFLSDGTIMAGTDNDGGAIIVSHDTGRTWSIDMSTLTFAYPDIKGLAVSKRDSFIAVGHGALGTAGIILWQVGLFANSQITTHRLNAVAMRDDSVAYVVGDSGTIYSNRSAVLHVPINGFAAATINLYPNPATEVCYTKASWKHTIKVYDALGRLVLSILTPAFRHTIPLNGLRAGTYLIQVMDASGRVGYQQLVVQ